MRRDPRLIPLSREHHAPLRLGRKLIAGGARDELRAMHPALQAHFAGEERTLLPRLRAGGERALAQRLLDEHRALSALFVRALQGESEAETGKALIDHVRFEERELFPVVEALFETEDVS